MPKSGAIRFHVRSDQKYDGPICADEGVAGRKVRRAGLDRMKAILHGKHADVLFVFKVWRPGRLSGFTMKMNWLIVGASNVSEQVWQEALLTQDTPSSNRPVATAAVARRN